MNTLACPIELKFSAGQTGAFEGYASVFGVLDFHRDVIAPGAFKATISQMKARGFNVPMYLNHGAKGGADGLPSGVWDSIEEDDKGLAVKGRVLGLDTDIGRYRYDLVKGGALRGISIGYRVAAGGATYGKTQTEPRRTLKAVDLAEISLVDNPSNHMASVTQIKSADDFDPRELEAMLREATLSRSDAVKAVAVFRKMLQREAEEPATSPRDEGEAAILAQLRRNIAVLSTHT